MNPTNPSNKEYRILITGTPGTGKSTVSKLLASKLKVKYININDLAEKNNWFLGFDEERKSKILDVEKISNYLSQVSGSLVIDTHVPEAAPKNITHVFVLRKHPKLLFEALKKKKFPEKKILENVEAEIIDSCLTSSIERFSEEKIYQLNVTNLTPKETVKEIILILKGGMKKGNIVIDWVRELEEKGEIEKYLSFK